MTPQGASQECPAHRPSDTRVKTAGDTWCASKKHATRLAVEQTQPLHFSHISQGDRGKRRGEDAVSD